MLLILSHPEDAGGIWLAARDGRVVSSGGSDHDAFYFEFENLTQVSAPVGDLAAMPRRATLRNGIAHAEAERD